MKIKIQLLTICLFLATHFHLLFGATTYILQDDSCMDRLVYTKTVNGVASEQAVYRIQGSPFSYVYLEISPDNQRLQELPPPQVVTCANGNFDDVMVEDLNANKDKVYMVMPTQDRKYVVAEVVKAAFFEEMEREITYISRDFNFVFNRRTGVIGENIARGSAGTQIFFEGKMENNCSGFYLFRRIIPKSEKTMHTDFVLIPEVGISEVRQGLNANDAFNNVERLEKVNTYLIDEYLRLLCDEQVEPTTMDRPEIAVKGGDLQPKGGDLQPKTPDAQKTGQTAATSPCGEASGGGFHIVEKGQTLYRISKMYEVTVSDIKNWNSLRSNTIYPCDKLQVTRNPGTTAKTPTETIVDNTPAVTTPAPYDQYVAPKGVSNATPAWQSGETFHIVRPGETVAAIALRYGYTEARFRMFNRMGPDEVARVGQPLLITDCPCPPGTGGSTARNNQPQSFDANLSSRSTDMTPKSPLGSSYDFANDERITPQFYMDTRETGSDLQTRGGGSILSTELQQRSGTPTAFGDNTIPQRYESGTFKRATHVLKNNETLYDVARMYGITVERLRALNNLSASDVVIPYQRLYIN